MSSKNLALYATVRDSAESRSVPKSHRRLPRARIGLLAATALLLFRPSTTHAVPSFARQMDTQCIQCHTGFPILTELGRQFKLSGC